MRGGRPVTDHPAGKAWRRFGQERSDVPEGRGGGRRRRVNIAFISVSTLKGQAISRSRRVKRSPNLKRRDASGSGWQAFDVAQIAVLDRWQSCGIHVNGTRWEPSSLGNETSRESPTLARRTQARASRMRLNGVSVARRQLANPASSTMISRKRFSPAWAPSAAPVSWANDVGTHTIVEAE